MVTSKKRKTCSRSGGLTHSAEHSAAKSAALSTLTTFAPRLHSRQVTCLAMESVRFEDYEEDTQHLEGLSPSFTSQVDVMLCCRDGQRKVAFPSHKTILSAHSPILSKILEELQPTSDDVKRQPERLPQLPMVSDDCAALRSALQFVYAWVPSDQDTPYTLLEANLNTTSTSPEIMMFAHKYGMSSVLLAQEAATVQGLHDLIFCTQHRQQSGGCSMSPDLSPANQLFQQKHTQILECTAIAARCGCNTLLTFCEACIVVHFHIFQQKPDVLTGRLSTASMYMISQGLLEHQQHFLLAIREQLGRPILRCWHCKNCQGIMKVKSCFVSHSDNCMDAHGPPACRWTDTFNRTMSGPATVWRMAEHLARLRKLPLTTIWHQMARKYSTYNYDLQVVRTGAHCVRSEHPLGSTICPAL